MPINVRDLLIKSRTQEGDMSLSESDEALVKHLEEAISLLLEKYKNDIIEECMEKMEDRLRQDKSR